MSENANFILEQVGENEEMYSGRSWDVEEDNFFDLVRYLEENLTAQILQPIKESLLPDSDSGANEYKEHMIETLNVMRGVSKAEFEKMINNYTTGLFMMAGLDYEPDPEKVFSELLDAKRTEFTELLAMSEEELDVALTPSEETNLRADRQVLGPHIEYFYKEVVRVFMSGQEVGTLSSLDLKEALKNSMAPENPEKETNLYGMTRDQIEDVVNIVVDGIVDNGLFAEGKEVIRSNEQELMGEGIINESTMLNVGRFTLKCVKA